MGSQHGPMDQGYGSGMEECCREKMVGSVSYTLLDDPFRGQIPRQCLNDCVYTVSGTSRPKFCFEPGDLPSECLSEAAGSTGPPVHAGVQVKSATTGGALSNVTVKLIVDNLDHFSTTDDQGIAIFTLSIASSQLVTVEVAEAGFIGESFEWYINVDGSSQFFAINISPELADHEYRLVLSWDTTQDLDTFVVQKNKTTGEVVCTVWWSSRSSCAGVNLDVDNTAGYGPETVTWSDAENDP